MNDLLHLYRQADEDVEWCFNIETSGPLNFEEIKTLKLILAEAFIESSIRESPQKNGNVIEVGPRLSIATPFSTNCVAICQACGLTKITRIERSRRLRVPEGVDQAEFIRQSHDRMTEEFYAGVLKTFETGIKPDALYDVPLKEKGPDALLEIPGIAMDAWDRQYYYDYFVGVENRNPTILEIMDLNNANSEHSRHLYFRGQQVIDGQVMPETLMEIIQFLYRENPRNAVLAFNDNSSAIQGHECWFVVPVKPGEPSAYEKQKFLYHYIITAETHNFPTGVAPYPGAETGTGGRIRDIKATGRGAYVVAGAAGYCVAGLHIPGYPLPWENSGAIYPENLAHPLQILIQASNGASDYGNCYGEPVLQGFTRSYDLEIPGWERWAFVKPILYSSGVGHLDARLTKKNELSAGMLICMIGGPAYNIGFGGGASSSQLQGDQAAHLDFTAVQRGDAEKERKMDCALRAGTQLDLFESIHDQGAGGPLNVLKELVEKNGGKVYLSEIQLGDKTMSLLSIGVAEYQERNGVVIRKENLPKLKAICEREKVNLEVLGEVTDDGRFQVFESPLGVKVVDFDLDKVLGKMPQKTYKDERIDTPRLPLVFPDNYSLMDALDRVMKLVSVGSKRFLTNKVDRSVTGLIAQQQCVGPMQLPLANVAVVAQSHFEITGQAKAIGEQSIKLLLDPKAGARMAVAEMMTNMASALITDRRDIGCSVNWMWAPKLPGEGAAMYDAACALRDFMRRLGCRPTRGKDSLSMATKIRGQYVKSPRQMVVYGHAPMDDIRKKVTPDIKETKSELWYLDLSGGKTRLGASALAQVYSQLGDDCPDVYDEYLFIRAFECLQRLIGEDLILSLHDVSDGGLVITALEMLFAGNLGGELDFASIGRDSKTVFAEELGYVIEVPRRNMLGECPRMLDDYRIPFYQIGRTSAEHEVVLKTTDEEIAVEMEELRDKWEETSYELEKLQSNRATAEEEGRNIYRRQNPVWHIPFEPVPTEERFGEIFYRPKVAILREEGSNGEVEMAAAFYMAGFEPHDITMTDLLAGRAHLKDFVGLAAVGGFSFKDVPESAKGWASVILFNSVLRQMFDEFRDRPDTFSLGVCNGCQLLTLLNWGPCRDYEPEDRIRLVKNKSGRFESRWGSVRIMPSSSIMLKGMEGAVLGIWSAHGEGRFFHANVHSFFNYLVDQEKLAPLLYVNDSGEETDWYPFCPNGSPRGIAGLVSEDGRHLMMMPHPERAFLKWQWPYLPRELDNKLEASPWLTMFQNAHQWHLDSVGIKSISV